MIMIYFNSYFVNRFIGLYCYFSRPGADFMKHIDEKSKLIASVH